MDKKFTLNGPDFYPKSNIKPKKIVILLHGVGADGENLMPLATEFSKTLPDAYFVAPNGAEKYDAGIAVNGSFGFQWFSTSDRTLEKMSQGVQKASEKVSNFISEKLAEFDLSYSDLIIVGFSQGAMTAIHTSLRLSQECAAVICFSGGLIVRNCKESEIKSKPPVCMIHGMDDDVVPYEMTETSKPILESWGVECEAHGIPALFHSIDYNGLAIASDFLQRKVYKKAAA